MPKAKEYARQALEINPNTGRLTHRCLGLCKYEYDWAGAEQNYRKAIELNPNHATANHWYGIFLFTLVGVKRHTRESKSPRNWIQIQRLFKNGLC